MTFYGNAVFWTMVAWKEVDEDLGLIKVVVLKLSSDQKRKHTR